MNRAELAEATSFARMALTLPESERADFLDESVTSSDLRAHIDALMANQAVEVDPSTLPLPKQLGRFAVLGELGRGGMGIVYRGHDSELGRAVAIKVVRGAGPDNEELLTRLQREASILARINHPNIAVLYDIGRAGPTLFLVMELVEGAPLSELLEGGPLPIEETLNLMTQLCDALAEAHALGIVHRDLKPHNLMVLEGQRLKILDFGIAKIIDDVDDALSTEALSKILPTSPTSHTPMPPALTLTGAFPGSAGYMSPEQVTGSTIDAAADVWGLGCVLFECLAGRPAFAGTAAERLTATKARTPDWAALPTGTTGELRAILEDCFREPSARPDVGSISARLSQIEHGATRSIWHQRLSRRSLLTVGVIAAGSTVGLIRSCGFPPSFTRTVPTLPRGRPITFNGNVTEFDLSEDGRVLAYTNADGGLTVYWIDEDHTETFTLPVGVNFCALTSDGSRIVTTRSFRHRTYWMDSVSGRFSPLGPMGFCGQNWSPDGKAVVGRLAVYTGGGLLTTNLDETKVQNHDVPDLFERGPVPLWLRGDSIVFQARSTAAGGHDAIWRLDEGEATYLCAGWAPRRWGTGVIVLDKLERRASLIESPDTNTWKPRPLIGMPPATTHCKLAAASKRAAYLKQGGAQVLIVYSKGEPVNGSETWHERWREQRTGSSVRARISPDGSQISTSSSQGLLVTSLESPRWKTHSSMAASWHAWSPDGTRIAFSHRGTPGYGVWMLSLSDGSTRHVTGIGTTYLYWFSERSILCRPSRSDNDNFVLVDATTGEVLDRRIPPVAGGGTAFQISLSPDRRQLVVAGNRPRNTEVRPWLIDLETGHERLLCDEHAGPLGWTPDSKFVYLISNSDRGGVQQSARILKAPIEGGRPEEVLTMAEGPAEYSGAHLSADGNTIAVVVNRTVADLYLVESDILPTA